LEWLHIAQRQHGDAIVNGDAQVAITRIKLKAIRGTVTPDDVMRGLNDRICAVGATCKGRERYKNRCWEFHVMDLGHRREPYRPLSCPGESSHWNEKGPWQCQGP